jgi:hypothetical protein
MDPVDPIELPKEALNEIAQKISLPDSPVGIDASYTHALIITYLQQINERLERLENRPL